MIESFTILGLVQLFGGHLFAMAACDWIAAKWKHAGITNHDIQKAFRKAYDEAVSSIEFGFGQREGLLEFVGKRRLYQDITSNFTSEFLIPFAAEKELSDDEFGELARDSSRYCKALRDAIDYILPKEEIQIDTVEDLLFTGHTLIEADNLQKLNADAKADLMNRVRSVPGIPEIFLEFLEYKDLFAGSIVFFFNERIKADERVKSILMHTELQRIREEQDQKFQEQARKLERELNSQMASFQQSLSPIRDNLAEVLVSLERLEAEWAETTKYLERILDLILLDKGLSDKERRQLEVALSPTFDLHARYQFDERKPLGYGLVAVVYRALHKGLKQVRALKVLKPEHKNNKEIVERFLREATVLGGLKHPNIVQVYDSGGGGTNLDFYLEMEYVDGTTLHHFIKTQDFNWERTLKFIEQLGSAIKTMHTHGIIHRDLNPRNIMVDRNGDIKVMDFGVAKIIGVEGLTRDGQVVGTTAYMSPEQARGERVDDRSDIYSYGVILYELCTRRLPSSPLLPLRQYQARVPEWMESIVEKCLKQERELRYSTMDELLAVVEKAKSAGVTAKCSFHPSVDAVAECVECGRMICGDCVNVHEGEKYCRECAGKKAARLRREVLAGRPARPTGRMEMITSLLKRPPVRAGVGVIVIAIIALVLLQIIPLTTGETPAVPTTPSSNDKTPAVPASVKPVKLVYETFLPDNFLLAQSNTSFFNEMAKLSNGTIEMEYRYEVPQTADSPLIYDVGGGDIDCSLIPLYTIPEAIPLSKGLALKCLTCKPDALAEAAMNVYNSYAPLWEEWEVENNAKVLHFLPMGNSTLCTAESLDSMDDLSTFKCGSNSAVQDIIELVGAEPRVVPLDYLYTALEQGEIDGAFLPLHGIYDLKLFEVANNLIDTSTGPHALYATVINKEVWDELSDAIKTNIEDLSRTAFNEYMENYADFSLEAVKEMIAAGANYYLCPEYEQTAIKDKVLPAQTDDYIKVVGDSGRELITLFKEELASCEMRSTCQTEYEMWQAELLKTGGGLFYEDDFSDPESGWTKSLNESGEWSYQDGEYHMTGKKYEWWMWDAQQNAGRFTDFEMEVDARMLSGHEESGYGMIFRYIDSGNFYLFAVNVNGNYTIRGYRDKTWFHIKQGKSGFIDPDDSTNHLKVVCKGSQIEAYVNGYLLATVKDATFTDGFIGLTTYGHEPGTHVAFDNIRVRELPESR
jgi:TRAP-type C4-dicarboxylate transport system substrate-binding protein/tRNA A-37 threonylcarbamoyl transferase component Bud32